MRSQDVNWQARKTFHRNRSVSNCELLLTTDEEGNHNDVLQGKWRYKNQIIKTNKKQMSRIKVQYPNIKERPVVYLEAFCWRLLIG